MKLPWLIALISAGTAIYIVNKREGLQPAGTGTDPGRAATQVGSWGTKQRVTGTGGSLLGQAKQGVGQITGDKQMQGEGALDEAVGNVKDTAGKAASAVSGALRDVNKS